jgi:2-desacetyl-2-hydroxyethyl bacteriochlorophyllide A dehydrogenase
MRAAILDAPGALHVGSAPDPAPGPRDVVVRVAACGVCGSDLHLADGEIPGTPYPLIPGHEFAGEVVAVGSEVGGVAVGARVTVDPSLFCGQCAFCQRQRGNLCANWGAIGATVDGAFAEYVRAPAANVYELPDAMSYAEAALVEPLACAVQGMRRLDPEPGDKVLIVGAGTIGLVLLQLVLRCGAASVAAVDIRPERLRIAERLGAARVAALVDEALDGEPLGFDCVIDATGVPAAVEAGLGAVRRGGKLLIFGVAPGDARIELSPFRVYRDEITVLGSMAVLFGFRPALDLLAGGVLDTSAFLTHRFALDQFPIALDALRGGEGVKVQIVEEELT